MISQEETGFIFILSRLDDTHWGEGRGEWGVKKVLILKGTQSLLLSWFIAVLQCLLNKTININLSPESCAEKGGGAHSTTELQNNI